MGAWKQRIPQHMSYPGWSVDKLWKIQTFHEYHFLCFCENVFRKVENKFVGRRYWGRPILLIIEDGKLTNMCLFLLVKDVPK
jgi:hypothetical protein